MWQNGLTENGEEPSELGSQNKHRGEEAAGSACRVRQGPQKVSNGEEQREQGRALQPGECALCDCITTSDKPWSEPGQHSHCCPNQGGAPARPPRNTGR